jgi:hypothetical protein
MTATVIEQAYVKKRIPRRADGLDIVVPEVTFQV